MGCCFGQSSANQPAGNRSQAASTGGGSRAAQSSGGERPLYSWEKRRQEGGVDLSRYKVEGLEDGTAIKSPGDVDSQHFMINNCKNSTILVFDHCDSVTVENSTNCRILIGPTKGSVFFRNCSGVQCALVCQQFRSRDCRNFTTLLFCATQPIIEASSSMKFGCLQLQYNHLEDQLRSAGLCVFNNCWPTIFDFTADGKQQWSLLPMDATVGSFLDLPAIVSEHNLSSVLGDVSTVIGTGAFPLTHGEDVKVDNENCLVVFFEADKDSTHQLMMQFVHNVAKESTESIVLVQTKLVKMSADDSNRIFGQWQKNYKKLLEKGPVVGMEVCGDGCSALSEEIISDLNSSTSQPADVQPPTTYVSPDRHVGEKDVEQFYHFVSMVMSA